MTPLDAALGYAARGWPVFPCWPGRKNPHTEHGVLDATTDPAQIEAWWTRWPDANVAIATGQPGPDVIDFDVQGDADYSALAELTNAGLLDGHGDMVRTRSGGLHVYFQGSSQRNGTIRGRHTDFRSQGGYVIAPPSSVEADDKPAGRYELVGGRADATAAIDWRIIKDLLDPPPPFQQPAAEKAALTADRAGDEYAARNSWPDILTPHGWRQVRQVGQVRYWCRPGKTGRFISASTRDDGGLWVFSTSTEFDSETLYSKFGAYAILAGLGKDYRAAAAQLRQDGYGAAEPVMTFTQPPQPADSQLDPAADWWSVLAAKHIPVDWQQLFDDTPPEEDWIVEPLLAAGRSIALYSPAKAGKSLIMLEIAGAIVTGRPVLGHAAGRMRRVLYVDLENSRRDLRDRLVAFGYKAQDLAGLIYLSFPSLPALDSPQGGREIVALAVAHQVDVVIIDTVSRVISGKENDADTFAALYRYAMAPLKGLGIAVARLDHAGKDIGKGQRGSSAKNADVDAVWTLSAAGPIVTLQCEMSRTQIEDQRLTFRRQADPLRHEITAAAAQTIDKVQMLMAKLDELEVPRDATNRQCQQALNRARIGLNTNDLRAAVRTRKMQVNVADLGKPLSQDHETNDLETGSGTVLSQDQQTSETGFADLAIYQPKHLSQDQQTAETNGLLGGQAKSVSTGTPSRREGSGKTDAGAGPNSDPVCTSCGEHHQRYGTGGRPCFRQPASPP